MPDHDEQELDTLMDALRELAGRLEDDGDRALIEEAVKGIEALAELEAQDNGEDEDETP